MKVFEKALVITDLLAMIGGEYRGEAGLAIRKVGQAEDADKETVIFVEQEKYLEAALASQAGLIISSEAFAERLEGRNLLISAKPYVSLMTLVSIFLHQESSGAKRGIDPSSMIDKTALLGENVSVEAHAVISEGARIGKGSTVGAGCYVGKNVIIGEACQLHAGVRIYEDCILHDRVEIHSGTVIGADGFGYLLDGGKQNKIPQIGNVVLFSDVEIGANTCIDRATLGSTVVGEGTKIDNLVQIGHNCIIGKHSIICAQVGLAGSTIVGDYVYLAGQVGAAGHLKIGDRAMVGAQSGITNTVPDGAKFFGSPAREANTMKRIMAAQMSLPEIYKHYHKLIKREED